MSNSLIKSRMTNKRKAAICKEIYEKRLTVKQVMDVLDATDEEVRTWLYLYKRGGDRYLRSTRIQDVRKQIGTGV